MLTISYYYRHRLHHFSSNDLLVCEHQLYSLDMAINAKKSSCMRIGPRFNANCCNIITEDCRDLLWCDSLRYFGVLSTLYINSARTFSCSYSHAKQSTYRAFNAVFGKVGCVASSEVEVQLYNCLNLSVFLFLLCTMVLKLVLLTNHRRNHFSMS